MKLSLYILSIALLWLHGCDETTKTGDETSFLRNYLDFSERDDQKNYMGGLVKFMKDLDQGNF